MGLGGERTLMQYPVLRGTNPISRSGDESARSVLSCFVSSDASREGAAHRRFQTSIWDRHEGDIVGSEKKKEKKGQGEGI